MWQQGVVCVWQGVLCEWQGEEWTVVVWSDEECGVAYIKSVVWSVAVWQGKGFTVVGYGMKCSRVWCRVMRDAMWNMVTLWSELLQCVMWLGVA